MYSNSCSAAQLWVCIKTTSKMKHQYPPHGRRSEGSFKIYSYFFKSILSVSRGAWQQEEALSTHECVHMCVSWCEDADSLVAATSSDHHVAVFFENDIRAVIKVKHWDGVELCGGTTRLRNRLRVNKMNLGREVGDQMLKSSLHHKFILKNGGKKYVWQRVIHWIQVLWEKGRFFLCWPPLLSHHGWQFILKYNVKLL